MGTKVYRLFVTVGTSVFKNLLDWSEATGHAHHQGIRDAWESHLRESENEEERDLLKSMAINEFMLKGERTTIQKKPRGFDQRIRTNKEWITLEAKGHRNKCGSAEIQSIEAIISAADWKDFQFELHLVSTETNLSFMAAEVIKTYFEQHPRLVGEILIKKVTGLQVKNDAHFLDKGLQELVGYIFNPKEEKESSVALEPSILNITGGYKGIVPILTILGQLLKMPIVYLYENSEQLIKIYPLPITFDWTYMELFQYYFAQAPKGLFSHKKLAKEEFDLFESEIVGKKLMQKEKEGEDYTVSYLGKMLGNHIGEGFSGASAAFGMPIEFLFYEYLLREPINWKGAPLNWVEHSKKISEREFDLALYYSRPSLVGKNEIIGIVEVASFMQLYYNNGESFIKKQFPGQIKLMKKGLLKPDLYLLYLYAYQEVNRWKILDANLEIMWKQLKAMGVQKFEIYTIDLPLKSNVKKNRANIYTTIYQKKLTPNKRLFKSHEKDKYGNPYLLITKRKVFELDI